MSALAPYVWSLAHAPEAIAALARHARIPITRVAARPPNDVHALPTLAEAMGVELQSVAATWQGTRAMLAAGRSIVPSAAGLLVVLGRRGARVAVLTPELRVVAVAYDVLVPELLEPEAAAEVRALEAELAALGVPAARRAKAMNALADDRLGARCAVSAWVLRTAPHAPLRQHLREAGVFGVLGALVSAVGLHYGLSLVGWLCLALGALSGRLDPGWLVAWGLVLVSQIPLRAALTAHGGELALRFGAVIKRVLLLGALRSEPDRVRAEGVGGLIGRAIESEAFEALAINGGLALVLGMFELVVAVVISAQGAAGGWVALAAVVVVIATAATAKAHLGRLRRASALRYQMTGELIENMVGHRTRLAQEPPAQRHHAEDALLSAYLRSSRAADALEVVLATWPQRVYLALGLGALALTSDAEPLAIALGVGGVLLGGLAIERATSGITAIALAVLAREAIVDQIAAARHEGLPSALLGSTDAPTRGDAPVLELAHIGFAYPGRARPVLDDVALTIRRSDRVLLEGASGSGKSTLAAIMAGLRAPSRGLMLLRGLDLRTWGERAWRKRVVAAPQFHDNRVIAGTLAFNLLLGRGGVPEDAALAEAHALCLELGLGPLIERMPAGLLQQVGESGWQLSHGEKSRIYLARALLQGADVVLLDESFGPLDPDNQARALRCVLARAPALVVIAHP